MTRAGTDSRWMRGRRSVGRLLSAPDYPDEQDRRAAALANAVLWVSLLGPIVYALATVHLPLSLWRPAPLLVAAGVPVLGLWALKRGWLRATSVVLIGTFLVVPFWGALDSGGIRAPSVVTLFIAVVLAGQLLGVSAALAATAVAVGEVVALLAAGTRGWLPPPRIVHTDQTYGLALVIELVACGAFAALAARLAQVMLGHLRSEQRAAREASTSLREAFEASPDAIISLDEAGFVTQANRAHELLLGRPRRQIIGRHFTSVNLSPEAEQILRDRFAAVLAGEKVALISTSLQRHDGTEVWIEVNPRLAVRADASRSVEVVIRDVTDRVQAERRHRELESQLEVARRLESIGRLAGGVAHDFNNVLTVILGNAVAGLGGVPDTPADDRQRFEAIRDAAERAARMTGQLLAFARRQEGSPRLVEFGPTLQAMRGFLTRLLPSAIELRIEAEAELPVRMDPVQLEQIVMNLVANARDAMPGGGRVTLRLRAERLDGPATRPPLAPGDYARLTVSDSGAGMDPATLASVFEPFFTTKPRGKGTGLGLATVWAIARQAGGHVFVSSRPTQGTTFEVFLPAAPSAETERPPGTSALAASSLAGGQRSSAHI